MISTSTRGGFAAAVRAALQETPPVASVEDGRAVQEWVWLIHDDSAPDPRALHELLLAVERAPSVTVAGTKQVAWDAPRKLIDVGISISRWAERVTLIDAAEIDQGQYDARSDVFAVNSAGMLIRRDVWDDLGGFDEAFPGSGDDVDFCWRNRLAGHRVVVVPTAVVRHVGARENSAASPTATRKAEVFLRLKHSPLWMVPFLAVGAVIGGVGRFLTGVLAKNPGHGFGQLLASVAGVLRPVQLYRSRRRAAASRRVSRTLVRPLVAERRDVWAHRRSLLEALPASTVVGDGPGTDSQETDVPTGNSMDDFASLAAPSKTWAGTGAMAAVLLLGAVAGLAMSRFFGAPALVGGALLPMSETLGGIWRSATSWWISVGSGFAGHGDPFDYVLWLFSVAGIGNANAAVVAFIFLLLPLAGLSAWIAAGALTQHRGLRFWAAMFWATVPALQVAMGSGRLGAMLVHLVLPLVALGMIRAVGSAVPQASVATHRASSADVVLKPGINGVPSWTAAAATGLALAIVTAGAPILAPLAVVAVLASSLAAGRRGKTLWWSLLAPAALFAPLVLSTRENLRAVVADPGRPVPFPAADMWQQLLGYPVAFHPLDGLALPGFVSAGPWALIAALLIGGPVLLLAGGALFGSGPRTGIVRLSWVLAVLALVVNALSAQLPTAIGANHLITPFTGPGVSALVLALLIAALLGADRFVGVLRQRSGRSFRRLRASAIAVGLVLALGPLASLAIWTVPQVQADDDAGAPVSGAASGANPGTVAAPGLPEGTTLLGTRMELRTHAIRSLPATAADIGSSPEQTKSLQLRVSENGAYQAVLMSGSGNTFDELSVISSAHDIEGGLGSVEIRKPDAADAALRAVVAAIVSGSGVDPRAELRKLGIGFVVLQESDTAANILSNRIDAVPGLSAVGLTSSGWLWRVAGPLADDGTEMVAWQTARVRIVDPAGATVSLVDSGRTAVDAVIPAGAKDRRLLLAERYDAGWTATLDGEPLPAAPDDWAQSFALPAQGGLLRLHYVTPWEPWVATGQLTLIGLTVLMAIPMPARRRFTTRVPGRSGLHDKRGRPVDYSRSMGRRDVLDRLDPLIAPDAPDTPDPVNAQDPPNPGAQASEKGAVGTSESGAHASSMPGQKPFGDRGARS